MDPNTTQNQPIKTQNCEFSRGKKPYGFNPYKQWNLMNPNYKLSFSHAVIMSNLLQKFVEFDNYGIIKTYCFTYKYKKIKQIRELTVHI